MSAFRKYITFLFLLLFAGLFNVSQSYSLENESKQQKNADLKKEKQKKDAQKIIDKGEQQHLKHQTKETRKRMKESQKQADKNSYRYKEPFYKRWFKKKNKR